MEFSDYCSEHLRKIWMVRKIFRCRMERFFNQFRRRRVAISLIVQAAFCGVIQIKMNIVAVEMSGKVFYIKVLSRMQNDCVMLPEMYFVIIKNQYSFSFNNVMQIIIVKDNAGIRIYVPR